MKKEVMHILLILVIVFCFNITNVFAQDTLIKSVNTDIKVSKTLDQEKSKEDLNSLNDPSIISEEENENLNNESSTNNEESNDNVEKDNEELLTLDELNKLDDKLKFTEDILTVKGNLFEYTNIKLINEIINKEEIISKYKLIILIIDKNNNVVTEDVIINDDFYLILKNETIQMKFKITFLFDFDGNYIVNEEDKDKILELMAEDSTIIESENLSYFDYVLKNKTYDVPEKGDISIDMDITTGKDNYDYGNEFDAIITNPQPPVEIIEEDKDNLPVENPNDSSASEIEEQNISNNPVEEDIELSSTNLEENLDDNPEQNPSEEEIPSEDDEEDKKIYMNIISGKIDYNHNALKLLSITFEDYKNLSTEEDSYLFWVDNLETIRIVLRFKVINQNSTEYITIYESDIFSEGKKIETEAPSTKIILNEIPKPAPPKEENKVHYDYVPKLEEKIIEREKNTDSSASNIIIKNHLIRYNHLTKNYTVTADYSETALDFDIILSDSEYATYKITGNSNFKVGKNLVVVTVTAEDGSTTDYNFNVIRMDNKKVHDKKKNKVGYDLLSINIFLGALLFAIGLIYKLINYRLNRY